VNIHDYAAEQVARRLGRVAFEIHRAGRKTDDEAVHDLRVSIRRLTQALRVFSRLLPAREARKIRKRLGPLLKLAGRVRDIDVARELIAASRVPGTRTWTARLAAEREEARRALATEIYSFLSRDFTERWRERLQLGRTAPATE
jgi:CHAD domain-containing protein